jgi:HlyD family secretion protein
VRIRLDAAPQSVIPATVSFVSDIAELAAATSGATDEARPLMVRVRAQIAPEFLQKYLTQIHAGLSGRAYIKTATDADWPADLSDNLAR